MESGRVKGPVCGVENCRSRIYEEAEDGYLYCQNGHRKGELQRGEDDEDNFSTAARTTTRKKKDDEDTEKGSQYFKGREAVDLYLKCLQLILRHQIWFLVHEAGLPYELENVVFDLWALRIVQLGDKIVNESQELDTPSQVYSTLEQEENETEKKPKGREGKLKSLPNLTDCLMLCYLGTSTLRLPVTLGDIYAWATDGKLVYGRAIKYIPLTMRERLPATYHAALDPNTLLKYKRMYATLIDLQISFEEDHGLNWSPLNISLLVFRYIKDLALPLELYETTMRLVYLLKPPYVLQKDGKSRFGIRHLPEAQLVGCFIVCVKLLFPFDGQRRYPKSFSEPTASIMDWNEWSKQINAAEMKRNGDNLRLNTEELTKLREKDVFSMMPHQLDQYLEFYADTFLDDIQIQATRDNDAFRNVLYDSFPIDTETPHPPSQISDKLSYQERFEIASMVSGAIKPSVIDESDDQNAVRPGQRYPQYRAEKDLSEHARRFYEEIARVAGFSMDMLFAAVLSVEAKVERWRRKQRELQKEVGMDGWIATL